MALNLNIYREALLVERDRYLSQGKKEKAANVDKELARLGENLSTGKHSQAETVSPSDEKIKVESPAKRIIKKTKGK